MAAKAKQGRKFRNGESALIPSHHRVTGDFVFMDAKNDGVVRRPVVITHNTLGQRNSVELKLVVNSCYSVAPVEFKAIQPRKLFSGSNQKFQVCFGKESVADLVASFGYEAGLFFRSVVEIGMAKVKMALGSADVAPQSNEEIDRPDTMVKSRQY